MRLPQRVFQLLDSDHPDPIFLQHTFAPFLRANPNARFSRLNQQLSHLHSTSVVSTSRPPSFPIVSLPSKPKQYLLRNSSIFHSSLSPSLSYYTPLLFASRSVPLLLRTLCKRLNPRSSLLIPLFSHKRLSHERLRNLQPASTVLHQDGVGSARKRRDGDCNDKEDVHTDQRREGRYDKKEGIGKGETKTGYR